MLTEGTTPCPSKTPYPLHIITERERLIKRFMLSMFMIDSKILRLMMSSFYVRVAKALVRLHACLVSIFRLLEKEIAVCIIPVVIATWEAIILHNLETQRETRV